MTHPTPLPAVDADVAALREALSCRPKPATTANVNDRLDHLRALRDFHENVAAVATADRLERILTALTSAQARAEAVEKDAARYRWLRDSQESDWAICEWANDHDGTGFYRDARNADIVEAAIDAAMAADSAIGGKGA